MLFRSILHGLTHILSEKLQYSGFESGVYGNPPSFNFWARQAALYVMSLTTMKLLVIMILILFPGILQVGEWLLRWTRGGDGGSLQVILCALHVFPSSSLDYLFITFPNDSVMGIFPIIMNVLQFWLIDSIVKASGNSSVELDDNSPELYVPQDREPLFRVPEDEDEDDYRPSDIENGRARQSSSTLGYDSHNKYSFNTVSAECNKHYPANTSEQPADHAYPPSLASSISSTQGAAPRRASSLGKPRRATPTPITIYNPRTPAINSHSPGTSPGRDALPQVPLVPLAAQISRTPLLLHPSGDDNAWAETWEDSEEWADRSETSQRIERTDDVRGGTSTILVGS